jgi:hypothetical protein
MMHKTILTVLVFALLMSVSAVLADTSYTIFGGALGEAKNIDFAGLDFISQPTISNPLYANPIQITMGIGSTLSGGSAAMSQNYAVMGDDQGSTACLKSEYVGKMVEGVRFSVQADIAPSFAEISASNIGDHYLSYEAFSKATVPAIFNSKSFANVMTYNKFYCDNTNPTTTGNSGSTATNQVDSQESQADTTSTSTNLNSAPQDSSESPADNQVGLLDSSVDSTSASNVQAVPQSEDDSSQPYTPPGGPAPLPTKEQIRFVPSDFKGDGWIAEDLSESLAIYYRSDYVPEDYMEEIVAAGFDYAKTTESNDIACQSVMVFAAEVK